MKRNFERNFSRLRSDIESYRIELQDDLKSLNARVNEIKSSVENAWDETNNNTNSSKIHDVKTLDYFS